MISMARFLSFAMFMVMIPMIASADVEISEENFPDENFRAYFWVQSYGADGIITDAEIKNVTIIKVNNRAIKSLKGIEFFTSLTSLSCRKNQLTSLDVSKNTALTQLECNDNQLTSLDVSKNTMLRRLLCDNNQIAILDVSKNTALGILECGHNQLTNLDVSNNLSLTDLYCYDNKLTSVDVSENTALIQLECNDNQLTSLDVSKNTSLNYLRCYENKIKGSDMNTLVNSLPQQKGARFYICTISSNEGNVCTIKQVNIANEKGWTAYRYNYNTSTWEEYSGSAIDVVINEENFPDANFRTYLKSQSYGADGVIMKSEINNLKSIDVHGQGISSLKGIEYFVALQYLYCYENQLTVLDVSKNISLQALGCSNNHLSALDVTKNKALTFLNLGFNNVPSIDVTKNTALTYLCTFGNQQKSLDLSNNTALETLEVSENQLTSLDVSNNTALTTLSCSHNQLTTLDVSKNKALKTIYCYSNSIYRNNMNNLIASLPVQNSAIIYIINPGDQNEKNICTTTQVNKAKAKGWTVCREGGVVYNGSDPTVIINETYFPDANFRAYLLSQPYGADGKITESEINSVVNIDVHGQGITSLKGIEYFVELQYLICYENQLSTLDITENTALQTLGCSNNQLSALDVTKNAALTSLNFAYNKVTSMDVSKNTALTYLCTFDNQLTSLDISNNIALETLETGKNQLTNLDVSKNTALKELWCGYNQIPALDVSANKALTVFSYEGNRLTALDISENTALIEIYGDYNNLSNIDVSHNVALKKLNCGVNLLTTLDVSNNPNLTLIDCSNNYLMSLDVSKNTALTRLYCYGNSIYGNNMDKLVGSLPVQENAQFWVYNSDDEDEKNVCTTIQVQQANAKGWIAAYIKEGKGYRYNGSDPAAVENITVDNNEIAEVYTFDGKRIGSIQKGLNIIKMKDGTTRKIIVR